MTHHPLIPTDVLERLIAEGLYRATTLWDLLGAAPPERTAVVCPVHGEVTYAALHREAQGLAAHWHAEGLRAGDVVILQLPNSVDLVIAHLALTRLGAVTLPLLPAYGERELRDVLTRSKAVGIVTAPTNRSTPPAELYAQLLAEVPTLRWTLQVDGSPSLRELARRTGPTELPEPPAPDDLTVLLATSGTTSEPKLAQHTHRSTVGGVIQAIAAEMTLSAADVMLMSSPLTHATGFQYGVRLAIALGTTVVLQDRWRPEEAARLVERHGVTWFMGATPFLYDMARLPDEDLERLRSLRLFVCGGAPLPDQVVATATERLPWLAVMAAWGLSETGVVTLVRPDDPPEMVVASDGRAAPGWDVRIVDEESGQPVPPGTLGEIQCRGAALFHGYHGRDDLTRDAVVTGGWFRTGDLGAMDEAGFLRCLGRIKDHLVRGGMNISAQEVESMVATHPAVEEVAVVGMPDARLGERICAVVVLRASTDLDLDSLNAHLRAKGMARTKLPERLELVDELPRTPVGKVQKHVIRDSIGSWETATRS